MEVSLSMIHYIAPQVGRTFILRMERGDYLRETIVELVKTEKIETAVVVSGIATFDEAKMHMVTAYDSPKELHIEHIKGPLELASLDGAIINSEPHIHGVIGNSTTTWAGHILDGCRILYLGEIVVQELLGTQLTRCPDKDGVMQICEKNS